MKQLERALAAADEVIAAGGRVYFEWPRFNSGQELEMLQNWVHKHGLFATDCDGCALGVVSKRGKPILKPWRIYNNDEQKNVSKFPGLGHIPIVGELFKSRAWLEKKSELVILLTPRLVGPGSKRVRRLIDDARQMYERSGQEVRFNIWD